jgi:hypothetical protein
MLFPYFVGLFIGTQIGKGFERTNNKYYHHTDRIITLENRIKEYENKIKKYEELVGII